jgi:hypothetical protein
LLIIEEFLLKDDILLFAVLSNPFQPVELVSHLFIFRLDFDVQSFFVEHALLEGLIALSVQFVLLKHGVVVSLQQIHHLRSYLFLVLGFGRVLA